MAKKVISLLTPTSDKMSPKSQVVFNALLDLIDPPDSQDPPEGQGTLIGYRIKDIGKDINNKVDWNFEAEICLQAVRKFPNSDSMALNWLGSSREAYIKELGGVQFFRTLKHTSWEVKRLAGLIKNAWEMISTDTESA